MTQFAALLNTLLDVFFFLYTQPDLHIFVTYVYCVQIMYLFVVCSVTVLMINIFATKNVASNW